jgi:hypothetical protein
LAALAILPIPAAALSAADTAPAAVAPTPSPSYSSGMDEILRMVDAKVNVDVMKAYIKNSSVAYNLSASEIITMKERGVPDEVVAALLQRGGELRAMAAQPTQAAPSTMPYPQAPYPQAPAYAQPPAYSQPPDYGYDYGVTPYYANYGYPYYSYGYPYNYWWYNSWYPWGYYYPYYYPYYYHYHYHDGHFHDGHFHNGWGHPDPHGTWAHNSGSPYGTFRSFGSRPTVAANSSAFGTFRGAGFSGSHVMASRPMGGGMGGSHAMGSRPMGGGGMGGGRSMGGGHR